MNKGVIAAGVIAALAVGGFGGYTYYKRTPAYTMNQIKESVEKHDYETFSKHVDTENVISCAFDDMVFEYMADEDDDSVKELAEGFIKFLKPNIVSVLNDDVKKFVKTGAPLGSKENTGSSDNQEVMDAFKEEIDVEKLKFKSIGSSRQEGSFTIITLTMEDTQLGKDFNFDLKARQLDDGTWQIVQISNLRDCIKEEKKAREEKLAEINAPIKAEIEQRVTLENAMARIISSDAWGLSNTLYAAADTTINSDKEIRDIAGDIIFKNNSGKVIKIPYMAILNASNKKDTILVSYELNPFLDDDSALIDSKLQGYSVELSIEQIDYSDGSTLELKTSLD